jgi:dTDP-4-dehydrorhamnose 3,5-epimerase-like enzyme
MSMKGNEEGPSIIKGGLAVDDRGTLRFVNDFNFDGVKRFYMVENHAAGFIRAWHGHRHEAKYVYVVSGAALVVAVRLEDARLDLPIDKAFRTVVSDSAPAIVRIPGGYYNGFKTLTPGCRVIFFSDASLEESKSDDLRLPFEAVNEKIWEIAYR